MSKYQIETDIDGFIERWLEFTPDYDIFVPASVVWEAMLHSAGLPPDRRTVWGMNRNAALRYMRGELNLTVQRMRYYHTPNRMPGQPPGYPAPCYEQLKLSGYALKALAAPMQVRPRVPRRDLVRV